MRDKPLHGIRVLDLTRLLPGPMATMHMADMGADVIKIEDTGAGDYGRSLGQVRDGMTEMFRLINRNKRALRIDLKDAIGREAFMRLAAGADVIIESFRPGVMDRLGIGYPVVADVNPKIVYCSITGYGQDGPYAMRAGHDINYIAYAGILDQIGYEDGAPVVPNLQIADLLGGALTPLAGILAALVDAKTSGKGRYIDVAMAEAALTHAVAPLADLLDGSERRGRGTSMLSGGLACYNVYATSDARYMAVGALEARFWHALCDVLGCPELKPQHLVFGSRAAPVKEKLASIFATHPQSHWVRELAHLDACVSPALTLEEALQDEHFRARGVVVDEQGAPRFAPALRFSEFDFRIERPAPMPGEHSAEVLREAGYTDTEIEALRARGVI